MIHQEQNFGDFLNRARAELKIAGQKLSKTLDPQKDLLVFGDHGFRLSESGKGFSHGADSTLERLTLAIQLKPRSNLL